MLEFLVKVIGCLIQLYSIYVLFSVYIAFRTPEDELEEIIDSETLKTFLRIKTDPKLLGYVVGVWFTIFIVGWILAFRIYDW